MQTVNFQCGGCGKLMGVSAQYLGQQVRCPHCQQVVVAPAAQSPEPRTEVDPQPFQNLGAHEDIFHTRSETEDALFANEAPRLEIPRDPEPGPTVNFPAPEVPDLTPVDGQANHQPPQEPTLSFSPGSTVNQEQPATAVTETIPWQPTDGAVSPAPAEEQAPAFVAPRQRREEPRSFVSGAFLLLVFLPVLLWALCATGIGVWLYSEVMRINRQYDPFEAMPDTDGDNPGIRPKGRTQSRGVLQIDRRFATRPVPEHLKVELGKTVRVGDLEVTPTKVMRRKVGVMVEGSDRAEPCSNPSLVLYLKLKNLSKEYAFTPLDNYFDRQYRGTGQVPLTLLQVGKQNFYGGPAKWIPQYRNVGKRESREWVEGRKNVDPIGLLPGEETEGLVCTDGEDGKMALYLFGENEEGEKGKPYSGELLWRVHLRRGPYQHKGRTVSATAVVGVVFSDKDYRR